MLRVIEDEQAIREWQRTLRGSIENVSTQTRRHWVGFPGGAEEADIVYAAGVDLWIGFREFESKFWNACGRGDPFALDTPAPIIEINLKHGDFKNLRKRTAGAVLQDEEGIRYLAHNGGIGGGTKGVSPTNFRLFYPAHTAANVRGVERPFYVLGSEGGLRLLRRINELVSAAADFKSEVKSGRFVAPPKSDPRPVDADSADDDDYSPEFEGTKSYSTASQVEANCLHGSVVRQLRQQLVRIGLKAHNDAPRDLFVPGNGAAVRALFEVKTMADTTSLYGCIGQLFFHGGAGKAERLIAVLPCEVRTADVGQLTALGVRSVRFSVDANDVVAFDGLDVILAELGAG